MKIKKLMRFYFFAGSLDRALNGAIERLAMAAGSDIYGGCEAYAEKIAAVIEVKGELGELWARLDGVLVKMTERDRRTLKAYAAARGVIAGEEKKEVHRAVVKFARRAANLLYGDERLYKLMCGYQALLFPAPD